MRLSSAGSSSGLAPSGAATAAATAALPAVPRSSSRAQCVGSALAPRSRAASAASAASAGGTAAKRPSLRRTLSSPAEKARLLLAEVRRIYVYI